MFNGVSALVFYVTALAVMFLVLCFDLWPLTLFPGVMKQPVLGLVWTTIALAGAALAISIGITRAGADPMAFPHPGHGSVHLRVDHRPEHAPELALRANDAAAQRRDEHDRGRGDGIRYSRTCTSRSCRWSSGPLPSGPPGYEREIWLANALLSVTFPFLIYHAVFFGYWPLLRTRQ